MKNIYFVFKNMAEADYYAKNLKYYLKEIDENIKFKRNPLEISLFMTRKEKVGFLKNILIKLKIIKPRYIAEEFNIFFKSEKSNLIGIHENIYHFSENDYDACYFIDLLKEINKNA